MTQQGDTELRWTGLWWPVALSVVAGAVAMYGALNRPVWHDELYTLSRARLPLAELLQALRLDSGPPLHYVICRGLYAVLGWPEGSSLGTVAVRLPSVIAFAAMPWVVWLWARRRPVAGICGPILTVVWLPMLYFATEARVYALLALVNGILWLLGPRLVTAGAAGLAVFAALAASLPMLHYTGAVSLLLLVMLFFFIPPNRRRPFTLAYAAAVVPLALWSPIMLGAPEESMAWVHSVAGPGRPGLVSLEVLAPAGPYPALFEAPAAVAPPWGSLFALGFLLLGVAGGSLLVRRPLLELDGARSADLTRLGLGTVPLLVLASLALAGFPVYFAGRSESLVWLPLVALVAAFVGLLPRGGQVAALAPYLAIGLWTAGTWLAGVAARPQAVGVQVGEALAAELQANDRVVVAGLWQLEVAHGLARAGVVGVGSTSVVDMVQTLPKSQADHPGWLDLEAARSEPLIHEARRLEGDLRATGSRLWVVWSPALPLEDTVFPAFTGWRRTRIGGDAMLVVDLLLPPVGGGSF